MGHVLVLGIHLRIKNPTDWQRERKYYLKYVAHPPFGGLFKFYLSRLTSSQLYKPLWEGMTQTEPLSLSTGIWQVFRICPLTSFLEYIYAKIILNGNIITAD